MPVVQIRGNYKYTDNERGRPRWWGWGSTLLQRELQLRAPWDGRLQSITPPVLPLQPKMPTVGVRGLEQNRAGAYAGRRRALKLLVPSTTASYFKPLGGLTEACFRFFRLGEAVCP
jgi:hypothetical protein